MNAQGRMLRHRLSGFVFSGFVVCMLALNTYAPGKDEVDGKNLTTPVDFYDRGVYLPAEATPKSRVDKVCELRGYEGASFWSDPGRFNREQAGLEGDGESPVADLWGFQFVTDFT